MSIQDWSDDIVLVELVKEPELGSELKKLIEIVRDKQQNVVIDFSEVDIIASSSLSKLLKLRKLTSDIENRLILCSMSETTNEILITTGLDGIFEFADDKFIALAEIEMTN